MGGEDLDHFHIKWAIDSLNDSGYQIQSETPKTIQSTPWSEVYRFTTDKGFVFLKKAPIALSLESKIIKVLHEDFHANVPLVIADNQELHCFLMHDAGIQLHDYFKQEFKANTLIQAIKNYTLLQIKTSERIDAFLDMGVPDWRLDKLPALYQDLISHENILMDDGLTKDELNELRQLGSKLISICDQLSLYKIKETFGHADFHDKNILCNSKTEETTLIDLGEVVITHPLFSFHNCLHRAKENFSLPDRQYKQLVDACLKPWLLLETRENLYKILSIIQQCWSIHSVLGEFRLMQSVDQLSFQELRRQGRLARNLRFWINQ